MTAALAVPVVLGAVAILVRGLRLLVDGTDFGRRWANDPPLCPWCGRRMSACQCEDDEVGF